MNPVPEYSKIIRYLSPTFYLTAQEVMTQLYGSQVR